MIVRLATGLIATVILLGLPGCAAVGDGDWRSGTAEYRAAADCFYVALNADSQPGLSRIDLGSLREARVVSEVPLGGGSRVYTVRGTFKQAGSGVDYQIVAASGILDARFRPLADRCAVAR